MFGKIKRLEKKDRKRAGEESAKNENLRFLELSCQSREDKKGFSQKRNAVPWRKKKGSRELKNKPTNFLEIDF